ncbi:MAG: RagB/SusD family nutrient uptake outer membrane protein [Bacteroidales bacterium]|nr:RagB/SusD family nutrient uptake outer membrane protein [Bacteroidales bacterium]
MKKAITIATLLLIMLTSCDNYLDMQPLDIPTTPEEIFSKKQTAMKYVARIYSFMPKPTQTSAGNDATGEPWVPGSDEADNGFNHQINKINNNSWNTSNIPYDKWANLYKGIRECTYFMQYIHLCDDITEEERNFYYNEARCLRAYCYWQLMRLYGPVVLVPTDWDVTDPNADYLRTYPSRNTWEECVQFVCDELDAVAPNLKTVMPAAEMGRLTPGAALAIKSQVLLYSASQLMNPKGKSMFEGWKSVKDGKDLIPTTYDANKWKLAADAAKAVIDYQLAGSGNAYELTVVRESDGTINPYKSLYDAFAEKYNKETILARTISDQAWFQRLLSTNINNNCWGGINPSQRLVDAYAMDNGVYPITGYRDATKVGDYDGVTAGIECTNGGEFPIKDPRVCKDVNSADNNDYYFEVLNDYPVNDKLAGYFNKYEHPFDGTVDKDRSIAKMYRNREPRFYIDIAYNALYYPYGVPSGNGKLKELLPNISNSNYVEMNFTYSGKIRCTATGYCQRKYTTRDINPKLGTAAGWCQPMVYPIIRLNEIYLNYVEALIEIGDLSNPDIWTYWNKIRERAGLPDIEEVYPEVTTSQGEARKYLRHERMVELALEGNRYFDCRRWQVCHITNIDCWGMNVYSTTGFPMGRPRNASQASSGTWSFYKRIYSVYGSPSQRVWEDKNYLWPINMTELNKNRNIEQAPGW